MLACPTAVASQRPSENIWTYLDHGRPEKMSTEVSSFLFSVLNFRLGSRSMEDHGGKHAQDLLPYSIHLQPNLQYILDLQHLSHPRPQRLVSLPAHLAHWDRHPRLRFVQLPGVFRSCRSHTMLGQSQSPPAIITSPHQPISSKIQYDPIHLCQKAVTQ